MFCLFIHNFCRQSCPSSICSFMPTFDQSKDESLIRFWRMDWKKLCLLNGNYFNPKITMKIVIKNGMCCINFAEVLWLSANQLFVRLVLLVSCITTWKNARNGLILIPAIYVGLTEQAWKSVTRKIFSKTTGKLKETPMVQLLIVPHLSNKSFFIIQASQ